MALLDYLLGGAAGGFQGYEEKKAKDLQAQKDEEERQIRQAQLYASLGMRAQLYRPASEAQVSVTPASSMARAALTSALQRGMGVEPSTKTMTGTDFQPTTAFQRSVQRGMGVEPRKADATMSPLQSAFQKAASGDLASSYTKRTAETPGIRQKLPGIDVVWQPSETEEEKLAKQLAALPESARARYEPILRARVAGVPVEFLRAEDEAKQKEKDIERLADLYQESYTDSKGNNISRKVAESAARQGKNPIEAGFIPRPMTEAERRTAEDRQTGFSLQREGLGYQRRRVEIAEGDAERRQKKATGDAKAIDSYYDNIKGIVESYMPTPKGIDPKTREVVFKEPKNSFSFKGYGTTLAGSDWTRFASSEEAQRYVNAVTSISDMYTVETQGRSASNADKIASLNQVLVKPGEFKNFRLMNDKWNRLKQMIEVLRRKEKENANITSSGGSALDNFENERF